MIQDIYPHKLSNVFVPSAQPKADDIIICVKDNGILVRETVDGIRFPVWQEMPQGITCRYLLSLDQTGIYYAEQEGLEPWAGFAYKTLREIRYNIGGPQELMYLAYTAWHLICWYRDNRYCGRCGHETEHAEKERALCCPHCGNTIYPRIVPAVVVGVTWGDKLLLTKYANRKMSFYALVAGFTEIGETLEECVAREVREETGLQVKNIRYYKSQPWGSVQDLIVGFYCDVAGDTDIRPDNNELGEAVWVAREDIQGQKDDWSLTNHMMMLFKDGREPRA